MSTIKEMLSIGGTIENAEKIAMRMVQEKGPEFWLDLELLYALQGKIKESWEVCQQATTYAPNDDRTLYNRGWHIMLQGDLLEGFRLMNLGRKVGLWGNTPLETTRPILDRYTGIAKKHVLFNCEAGFGDEITFIRYAKEMAIKYDLRITVVCSSGMVPILARIPEISAVTTRENALNVYHDYWMPSMLAPVYLKAQFGDISGKPYLTPNPEYVKKFARFINSDKLKVGIRWLGREGDDYVNRIFPRDQFFDAVTHDHVQLYSLQKDHSANGLPKHIVDFEIVLETWEDTAGAIANMDLIISSCTAIAHLAAAMGKPTWVLIPVMMYYIWCYPLGEKSYYYNTATLFRQEEYGNWNTPMTKIKERLKDVRITREL